MTRADILWLSYLVAYALWRIFKNRYNKEIRTAKPDNKKLFPWEIVVSIPGNIEEQKIYYLASKPKVTTIGGKSYFLFPLSFDKEGITEDGNFMPDISVLGGSVYCHSVTRR